MVSRAWTEIGGFHRILVGPYHVVMYWAAGEWIATSCELQFHATSGAALGWRETVSARRWAIEQVEHYLLARRDHDAQALADAKAMST